MTEAYGFWLTLAISQKQIMFRDKNKQIKYKCDPNIEYRTDDMYKRVKNTFLILFM